MQSTDSVHYVRALALKGKGELRVMRVCNDRPEVAEDVGVH